MLEVEGIGEVIASSVHAYLAEPRNRKLVERLAQAGLQMEAGKQALASDALLGKTIVISGTFAHHSREEYKTMIEAHGGKNVSSISKKTSFVLAGEGVGPSKLEKATKLGVPLVAENEFLAMLGDE